MSETSEVPLTPQETGEPPVIRMEDMEEFKKMSPEQQEYLLDMRERLQNEAMDPRAVVTRSIDEMGFFEGLKETVKPHLKKQKEILGKELKANASVAWSLIPVLGEGKGFGSGLFGLTVKGEKTLKEGALVFEPFVRGKKAIEKAKMGYHFAKKFRAADALKAAAAASEKAPGIVKRASARIKDIWRPAGAMLVGKTAAERSLARDFTKAAREGATVMATRFGVEGIQAAQRAKVLAKAKEYARVKDAVSAANAKNSRWIEFPIRWARSAGGEVGARWASMREGWRQGKNVTTAVKEATKSTHPIGKLVEGTAKRAAPTMIEGTKLGKFHAFFEKWLNLTPDVPLWLSTTTGILELLGAHGITAIDGVVQIGINRYKSIMVSKDMALDVLKYTATRGLRKLAERKAAAEVFSPVGA